MDYVLSLLEYIKNYKLEKVAEIGVWKGRCLRKILRSKDSSSIKEYYAIDPWKYLDERHGHMNKVLNNEWDELYEYCCSLKPYFPSLNVIRKTSEDASKIFPDKYFDLVFIDGSHFYDDIMLDIKSWLPKVKSGGFISGHDYGSRFSKHKGVKKAVDEVFGLDIKVLPGIVWIKQIA